jgi:hypothetical protein
MAVRDEWGIDLDLGEVGDEGLAMAALVSTIRKADTRSIQVQGCNINIIGRHTNHTRTSTSSTIRINFKVTTISIIIRITKTNSLSGKIALIKMEGKGHVPLRIRREASACTRTGDSEFARVAGKGESKSTNQQADV